MYTVMYKILKFLMYTDNLSLKSLFNEKQPVPVQIAGRIQRLSLILANFEYTMTFRPTHKHSNADTLSRLPTESVEVEEPVPAIFGEVNGSLGYNANHGQNCKSGHRKTLYKPEYTRMFSLGGQNIV